MPSLEEILKKVVLSDPEQIIQGTQELREAFKSPGIVPSLCNVLGTSDQYQIRQYAAVLLRKRLGRKKVWAQLSTDVKKGLKEGIIQALINEPEKSVKTSISQLIGVIVKHMKAVDQQWPELLSFLQQCIDSNDLAQQELGALALSGIAEMSIETLSKHLPSLCLMFKRVLEGSTDLSLPAVYYTINSMKLFVPALEDHKNCVSFYGNLVPHVLAAASALAPLDEMRACQELELLDELLESTVSCLVPHIPTVIAGCLQLALNQALGSQIRIKGILLTGWIARKKKKTFLKLDLLRPVVDALYTLMSAPSSQDDEDEDEDDLICAAQASRPSVVATQTLDTLALCLPPDKIIPLLAEYIEPSLQGTDVFKKKAAYLSMSVIVEGCSTYIRNNCLEQFVVCIAKGIADPSPVVRNAALFALGQFSDYLQPDITKFASQLLPVLFTYLEQLCNTLQCGSKIPAGVDRMFYALETFMENLDTDLLPYLPQLMERLMLTLDPSRSSPHLIELALSAVGSAASAAKQNMLPYFPTLIHVLRGYLTQQSSSEENLKLQVQALDTLSLLARGVGAEHFAPLARESLQLGLALARRDEEEVDLRKAAYGLFAAVSTVLKQEMAVELTDIVPLILLSIKSNDGIVTHFKDEADKAFPVYEEVRELLEEDDINEEYSDEDDDVCSDLEGYSLKNSYIQEKEEALLALKELAFETEDKFQPYIKEAFDLVYVSLSYPSEDVKTAAIGCISQICINWYRVQTPEALAELREALLSLVPKLAELVHFDPEHTVVMACFELFAELLKELKGLVLQDQGHKEAIINCIKDVLKINTECQKPDGGEGGTGPGPNGDEGEESGDEAEQDEMLFEYAADVLAPLGHAMPCEQFAEVFRNLLPIITSRTKKKCSIAQRSFSTGMLAECLGPLGPSQLAGLTGQLLPLLLKLSSDSEEDVRNNAVYALGELAKHGGETIYPHYPQILSALSAVLAMENGPYLLDNICGAIARLILAHHEGVPLEQVFPVFIQNLPLRSDFDEVKTVFNCIAFLYQMGRKEIINYLDFIITAGADIIGTEKAPKEGHDAAMEVLLCINRDFSDRFKAAVIAMPPETAARMQQAFSL